MQVCLPIHATPTRHSRAVDLRRWEMRRSTAVQWTLATVTQLCSSPATDGATTFVSSGVRRSHFSGGAFVILSVLYGLRPAHRSLVSSEWLTRPWSGKPLNHSRRLRKAACIDTTTNKYAACEVHHLAFHTCLSRVFQSCSLVPRFPVSRFHLFSNYEITFENVFRLSFLSSLLISLLISSSIC